MQPPVDFSSAMISDDEVGRFTLVALVINQVAADRSLSQAQRQDAVAHSAQRNKITSQRFNEIENAAETDPSLRHRIKVAAQAHIDAVRSRNSKL
jgi:hypothetical protein